MTRRLRVLDTGCASGRSNTALSAALLRCASDLDACVRFYRFTPCVLLGANQPYLEGPALAHCMAAGIEIARRITGGGNVFMSPTMLAWDVVMRQHGAVESLSLAIAAAFANALRGLGYADVAAAATGLTLDGRKLSGAAMGSEGGFFLYQGTLLIADETPAMAAALGIPPSALAPHLTSLSAQPVAPPGAAVLQAALAPHLADALGFKPEPTLLTEQEQAVAEREYTREIGTEAFVRGADRDIVRSAQA